jgi:hypothetical protein
MPVLTIDQLLASPDSLVVDGMPLTAVIRLNRDFFPNYPPEGRPMTAWVALNGSPPGSWPTSITDVYIWVIRDSSDVWATPMSFEDVDPNRNDAHIYQVGDGPLWDPGILVDVVIGMRSSPTKVWLSIFHGVQVGKTS